MPGDKWAQYAEQPTDKWAQYAEPAQGNASQASISDQPPGLLSRADSAITSFLAPNPHNYDSIASTNLKEAPKTLGRELYSGVKNIAGTPGAIYHAFADPPTDEEKQRISGDENQQPPDQIDYALDRMIVHPLQVAGKFYGDAIRGKVPDATGQMLNVAPEAMGISASGVVAPKLFKAAVPKLIEGARAVGKFAGAPSDPDILYQSYLKPVAGARMPVPNAPEPVMRAILRDMEAAGEGDAAARISRNEATVGDLDQVRQTANRLSRSIYRSPGNYTPGMAEGANNLANSIRERTYPFIESSQGMGPGSLQDVKKLQGAQMESARNPTLTSRVIKRGGGAIGGGAIGYKLGGPGGAALGALAGERLAEPIANAADRGIMGLRTKALAAKLPPPGLTPRLGLPFPRILSPIENEPGPPSFTEFSNSGTRASRLGLLLPEKATGKIELSGDPEMTPGERTAALEHELRRNKQRALPQKASPILLPKSNQ